MAFPKLSPLVKAVLKSNGMGLPIAIEDLVFIPLAQSEFSHFKTFFEVWKQSKVTQGMVRGMKWVDLGTKCHCPKLQYKKCFPQF